MLRAADLELQPDPMLGLRLALVLTSDLAEFHVSHKPQAARASGQRGVVTTACLGNSLTLTLCGSLGCDCCKINHVMLSFSVKKGRLEASHIQGTEFHPELFGPI